MCCISPIHVCVCVHACVCVCLCVCVCVCARALVCYVLGCLLCADDKYYNQNVQMRRTAGEDYRLAHKVAQKLQQQESVEEEERRARSANELAAVVAIFV